MTFEVECAEDIDPEGWDEAVLQSVNGTLFHTRRFLAYHGSRFEKDERFLKITRKGKDIARIAYARRESPGGLALLSPYGASFGGPILSKGLTYAELEGVAQALLNIADDEGADEFHLSLPIACCWASFPDALENALVRAGFSVSCRELTSVVRLRGFVPSSRARRTSSKARREGVRLDFEPPLEDFFRVLDVTYDKHGVPPTHSHRDLETIQRHVGTGVSFPVAYLDERPVAGLGVFRLTDAVSATQYICQDPTFQHVGALSLLLTTYLTNAPEGIDFVSLGTSSVAEVPRYGVVEFKENYTREMQARLSLVWRRGSHG